MTENNPSKIGGLLLAAGGSSRLGQPKQLVRFEGKTLIRRSGEMLAWSACDPVAVVLGAEIEESSRELNGLAISICLNDLWNVGISSSIKSGLRHLLDLEPDLDAVVIALCDQPHVTSTDIDSLAAAFRQGNSSIVASEYDGVTGVPALFSKEIFDQLFALEGDEGARYLVRRSDKVSTVAVDGAAFDIDTPDDLTRGLAE
jgi:molybdenum cofactor cytidylyltransferase